MKTEATELLKIAREMTAGSVLDTILPQRDFAKLSRSVDPVTYKMGVRTYQALQKRLKLSSDEQSALNKLIRASNSPEMASVLITGAANALGTDRG